MADVHKLKLEHGSLMALSAGSSKRIITGFLKQGLHAANASPCPTVVL